MSTSKESISSAIKNRLKEQADSAQSRGLRKMFTDDVGRAKRFSYRHEDLFFDLSKTHITDALIETYIGFAKEIDFNQRRQKLFSGCRINNSENRSVLHTLLRDVEALKSLDTTIKVHFIGNIDGHQLVDVLSQCDVSNTLVIGVSKTFTTAETLQNLDSVANWFSEQGVADALSQFYGVTANPEKAKEYGIPEQNVVGFPTWVGGRYSVWSSVSLSAALVIGLDKFEEFLAGAAKMDSHFYSADLNQNLPFLAAALDHYYGNFFDVKSKAIFAYDYRLRSLVDYLQQLETESNGKDRQRNGERVDQQTSPVVWGGVGTDVQHSVFQMLHQGTSIIPAEFLLVKTPDHRFNEHHLELLANGLAQPAALLSGQDLDRVRELHC